MTHDELTKAWTHAIEPLRQEFQAAVFKEVFEKGEILSLSAEELVVVVENKFSAGFIRKYGEPLIIRRLTELTSIAPAKIAYQFRSKETKGRRATPVPVFESPAGKNTPIQGFTETLDVDPHLTANLNPKFTFDSFIVGTKNRLAFAVSQAVAAEPGKAYNPLYLYGGVGLGKTHLMQAIGNEVIGKDPTKKVLYVSCEGLLNEFVDSIKRGKPEQFKQKYRSIDVLFVDDIQFIAGKDGVQEEFFHTFNALHQSDKQIVISSDKKPTEIKGLEERLSSRFSQGMVTDIQLPDKDTRQAILQAKCQEKRINLPPSVLSYIADQVETNIRELEGALNTVIADLMSRNAPPTVEEVRISLRTVISQQSAAKRSPASLLTEIVSSHYQIPKEDVLGQRRQKELVRPRQVLMYLLKHEAGMTFPLIGKEIGGRDHTTVMHGVDKITVELKKNPELLSDLQEIKNKFYEYK